MFKLIGLRDEINFGTFGDALYNNKFETVREVVATFDTRDDAEQYVEDSRLAKPIRGLWEEKVFRQKSLLAGYQDAEIEDVVDIVHNPEIGDLVGRKRNPTIGK